MSKATPEELWIWQDEMDWREENEDTALNLCYLRYINCPKCEKSGVNWFSAYEQKDITLVRFSCQCGFTCGIPNAKINWFEKRLRWHIDDIIYGLEKLGHFISAIMSNHHTFGKSIAYD